MVGKKSSIGHFALAVPALLSLAMLSCRAPEREWKESLDLLDERLSVLESRLRGARAKPGDSLRSAFRAARLEYKRMEFLWEYGFPLQASRLNGPAADEVELDDEHTLIPASGFQVIEAGLFPYSDGTGDSLAALVADMRAIVRDPALAEATWPDTSVLEAARMEIQRLAALGLGGFDSPLALNSLEETRAALAGMGRVLSGWISLPSGQAHPDSIDASARWNTALTQTIAYLDAHGDFASFDRAGFLTGRMDPLYTALIDLRKAAGIAAAVEYRAYSPEARTLFSASAWNPAFFAPPFARNPGSDRIELGRALFFDPSLSSQGQRACASCHRPELAFGDGLPKSAALGGHGTLARHTPSLLHAGFQHGQFWDSRAESLEDQADVVVRNPLEMNGSLDSAAARMGADAGYRELFHLAFSGDGETADRDMPVTPLRIRRALAAYIRSLAPFDSPWDRFVGGDSSALTAEARHGFNLFAGKAKCATCHFPPLFNGSVPPFYRATDLEVLGVPSRTDPPSLDEDPGRMAIDHASVSLRAFKTPTVRNAAFTAPYMHNGVFATLEEVIDFYDAGGGAGLGLDVPNQTLPLDSLKLSQKEKLALISFLKALSDTAGTLPPTGPAQVGRSLAAAEAGR